MSQFDLVVATIKNLQQLLIQQKATVATAESCTGGMAAVLLTELPGSSEVFVGGVAAYADRVKIKVLHVPESLIIEHGAVSAAVAEAMALGIRQLLGTTYGLSITGIAGPSGGTPAKPVGTVFCGIVGPQRRRTTHFKLTGDRNRIRQEAARLALAELQKEVVA